MVCLLRALVVTLLSLFFKLVLPLLLINRFMPQTLCQERFQRGNLDSYEKLAGEIMWLIWEFNFAVSMVFQLQCCQFYARKHRDYFGHVRNSVQI